MPKISKEKLKEVMKKAQAEEKKGVSKSKALKDAWKSCK